MSSSVISSASPVTPLSSINNASGVFLIDKICSRELLQLLMHDYLTSIYSLILVVYWLSVRIGLSDNHNTYGNDFLFLIVAIRTMVVPILCSKFDTNRSFLYGSPSAQTLAEIISRCYSFMISLRGPDYFNETCYRNWAASYLM
jgi:hypothetical protein